jgi:hypothetical protein
MRFAPTSFRPLFGRVLSVVIAVIAALGLSGFVLVGDWTGLLRFAAPVLLVVVLVFGLYWFPRVDVAEHEITVVNVFSTVHVPWPAIERIDTKWALTLFTPLGRVTSWALPAPNRYTAELGSRADARLAARDGETAIRPGDLPSSPSGAVAYVIRTHWQELRDDGKLALGVEPSAMRRDIHWPLIAALAALAVLTAVTLLL